MAGNLTAMIAAIFSGGVTPDPYYEYTTLLLPGNGTNGAQNNTFLDGSTNNFTITRNGNTTQGTFSPFSQTGWGNYFDGSADYLTVPANSGFNYGTSDFTIEGWFYFNSVSSSFTIAGTWAALPDRGWFLYFNTSLGIAFTFSTTGSNAIDVSSSYTPSANTWNHIAISRTGVNLYIFVNGVQRGSTYNISTSSIYANNQTLYLGNRGSQTDVYYTGYISNFRITKGVGVYTGTFTPPTAPLAATQSAGTNISAITGTQTSLLTCQSNRFKDNSTNNFTITINGDTRVVAFSPFNPTASWSAATNGGSGYFDGSGDYLQIPTNTAFNLGTGAFCVEFWVYITSLAEQPSFINNNSTNIFYETSGSNRGLCLYASAAAQLTSSTTALPLNAWNHVVICRNTTGTLSSFANGNRLATAASNTSTVDFSNAIINRYFPSVAGHLFGYTSDLRMVKGSTPYDPTLTTCTVPTAPLTAITNTSLLLNFTNAGIYDATSKNDLETVGNAQISTAISAKWGSGSMYFDGTGDYLASAATNLPLTFNTGDFTIEGWLYPASVSGGSFTIVSNRFDAGANTVLIFGFGTTYGLYFHTQDTFLLSSGTNLTANTWQNVVLCRASGTVRIFLGGTQVGSTTSAQNLSSTASMFVGQDGTRTSPALQYNGYMQDVRITKGYARYVTGTGANAGKMVFNGTNDLALPTAAFPTL